MCSRVWFVTDRRISQEYPQVQILRALKERCADEDVEFRSLLMDQIVLTISEGQLGLRVEQELVTSYPQVVVVRVPTPWVQSDSDITVLRHLEKMGCRLINRPQAILNCVNKFWTFQELAGHGVPLPDTFSYGKAVFLARDKHHLTDLCHLIRHDTPYLFQEYIKESHGRDVRVVLVGGRVIGSMLRCSTDGRMQSNCSLGGVGMMCPLSEQGKQLAIEVSNILGMDVCGIDLLQLNDGSFVVCEANANVGFIAFDQACGMDVAGIVADYALSMLPSRLTRKMSLLSVVSSTSETSSEPEVCPVPTGGGSLPEAVCNMSVGSTSSESDPELAEPSQSSPRQSTAPALPDLPDPAYNFNTLLANEMKLLTE
ncbi:beta-citrylglutamate synthase B isoform X2 [Anarrhichthys ocellatus]|uniref:beta-citrylglutamate synthase B isoform X2 n=1 Tax=Anarrhichthys ocellatus TaxID=433405 RepID=UPI0012ECE85A|nr:beta-citrylglutamate synthase B-like isoform X2 [Anarrhichthys ocellatus]